MFRLFTRRGDRGDWTVVYSTADLWEAEVVRSALLSENIQATVKSSKEAGRRGLLNHVSVPTPKVTEAQMVIRRTSIVISKKEDIVAEHERLASQMSADEKRPQAERPERIEEQRRPVSEPILLAEKDDVGKIIYYEAEDRYELRLAMGSYSASHFMSAEEWEEFIDFSAQRQEFFILLKEKYPKLADFLKKNKMRPSFLKLIEYSYGKSQPPRK